MVLSSKNRQSEFFKCITPSTFDDPTLSDQEREGLYALAFDAYTCENYEEGIKIFKYLTTNSSLTAKYWKGLAACLQQTKQFENALNAWNAAILLEENDPMSYLHVAQCLIALEATDDACKALNLAEEKASFDQDLQNNIKKLRACL